MKLHEKQQAFVNTDADRAAYIGARQSGKTTGLLYKLVKTCLRRRDIVVFTPSLQMSKEVHSKFRDIVTDIGLHVNGESNNSISFTTGATVKFVSDVRGMNPDALFIDEAGYIDWMDVEPLLGQVDKLYVTGDGEQMETHVGLVNDVVMADSIDNPVVDPSTVSNTRAKTNVMCRGVSVGGMNLYVHSIGEYGVSCGNCSFHETFGQRNLSSEEEQVFKQYALGCGLQHRCNRKT